MKRNALKREEMKEKYWTNDGKKPKETEKSALKWSTFSSLILTFTRMRKKKNGLQWIYLTDRRMKLNMQFMYFKWTFRNCLYALMMAARRFRYMIMTIVAVCPQTNFHGVFSKTSEQQNGDEKKKTMIFQYFDWAFLDSWQFKLI